MQPDLPQPVFLNVEYFFQRLFEATSSFFAYLFSGGFLATLTFFATILVILLITGVIFCLVRLYELKKEGERKQAVAAKPYGANGDDIPLTPSTSEKQNETWKMIRTKLLSDNPSDWRLAIIEADIYLDQTLDYKGFHGETLGDKLKQVDPLKLGSVQIAWEAHKMRNRIAHEGAAFVLTMPEARRVLSYYEIVFRDLDVIE